MITVNWTEHKKEQAIEKLTEYFKKYGAGECIMQFDNAIIEAPELLADIADNILVEKTGIIYNHDN